ncbi:glycosyltransferase family 39 protein [Armatimonas rosea]|uniref:4-amino-4-deoxy-L-arabinose transferase-like glycosyltransferase n=1 Tax=Armatimonas rosea TaxID=685828 RepID=A0A7W9SW41_ARMRO|nr:glycosyltransferase family 39 protein [Armatimonas rosea]MBB6052994.1 4-amino-4-deoxy-L-arabinose transferase-like glycosyltransferase [Armatimonas rosea]
MRVRLGVALLVVFLLVSRLLWLEADPWPRLDWSSGIWTDEGFYTYNARNAVLFGAARLDGFNNANLMPLLDLAQRLVFGTFGVHLVAARSLSVVASLLALLFFGDALRRGFGEKTALTGLALLGTDVFFWGYSRLALMELPATLVHCAAFWCLSLGSAGGLFAAGLLAAATLAFKATYAIFLPVPLLAIGWARRKQVLPYATGALVGLALYGALWGIPHRAEIAHMTNFYRTRQSQPRSVAEAGRCVSYALFGSQRNAKRYMVHCLETQAPVVTTVGLVGLFGLGWRRRRRDLLWRVLVVWAALGIGSLALTRYIPTRYLLLFLPALVGLAAVTLGRLPALWRLWRLRPRRRLLGLGIPLFFLLDHLLASVLTPSVGAGAAEWLAAGASLALVAFVTVRCLWQSELSTRTAPVLVALALMLNVGFVLHWAATRTYTLRDTSRTLGKLLPPSAVVIGEAAPLCLENRLRGIPVFYPGLANDKSPLQTFQPQYLMVTRVAARLRYWNKNAPQVLTPANELVSFPLGVERLVLYKIPPEALP